MIDTSSDEFFAKRFDFNMQDLNKKLDNIYLIDNNENDKIK
jgi:hypothetical protein